jgi:hypothetical protein
MPSEGWRHGRRGSVEERHRKQRDRIWSLAGGYPRHFLLRLAPPQHPLCSRDGLGAPDSVLGRVEPKRALGSANGGVQTSGAT